MVHSNETRHLFVYACLFVVLFLPLVAACKKTIPDPVVIQSYIELEKRISRASFPVDSLLILLSESEKKRDDRALAIVCKVIGQRLRDHSNFSQAIIYHQNGLNAALRDKETINNAP